MRGFQIYVVNYLLIFCLSPFSLYVLYLSSSGFDTFTHDCLSLLKFFDWIILGLNSPFFDAQVLEIRSDSRLVLKASLSVIGSSYYLVIGTHFLMATFHLFFRLVGQVRLWSGRGYVDAR